MHKSQEQLRQELREARTQVLIGEQYRHYKSGDIYRIRRVSVIENTDEIGVNYSPTGIDDIEFVRPLAEFLGAVVINDEIQPRFELVDD